MCFNWLGLFLSGMMITLCFSKNNYDARFESIVGFEGEGETLVDFRGLKIIGRERHLNGSAFFAIDATDDLKIFCKVYTQEVGVWVPMIYEIRDITTCELGDQYFLKYVSTDNVTSNFPKTAAGYCPLLKGEYWFNKWIPNTDKWVAYLKRGLLKFRFEFNKNEKGIGGFELMFEVFDRIS